MLKNLFLFVSLIVLSSLLLSCGNETVKPVDPAAPDDIVTSSEEPIPPDYAATSSEQPTNPDNTVTPEKWRPEGPLLKCKEGDMIYIPNSGPAFMENLSEKQKALIDSLKTGDIIRITIWAVEDSYPGHCAPEDIEFVRHEDYKPVIPVINDLQSLGWKIQLSVPSLEEVADSHISSLKEQLCFFTIEEIRDAWGEPESTLKPEGLDWAVDFFRIGKGEDQLSVDVQYNDKGEIIGGYTYRTADSPTIW